MASGISHARKAREARGMDLAVQLATRAAYDVELLAEAVGSASISDLRIAAATLALMVNHDLSVRGLVTQAAEVFGEFPCHPASWGTSWSSKAEHGTRSRYNAGCRGAACRRADNEYRAGRGPRTDDGGESDPPAQPLRAVGR